MRHAILAGLLIAACAFATSRSASAASISSSSHAYDCRLVNNSSVEIPGTYTAGRFVNNSGSSAWITCPIKYLDQNTNYYLYGSSNISTCYISQTSNSGEILYSPTTQSSGSWYWNRQVNTYNYSLAFSCYVPNGGSIYRAYMN